MKNKIKIKLKVKIALLAIAMCLTLIVISFGVNYKIFNKYTSESVTDTLNSNSSLQSQFIESWVNIFVNTLEDTLEMVKISIENGMPENEIVELISNITENNKDILGMYVGFPAKKKSYVSGVGVFPDNEIQERDWVIGAKSTEGLYSTTPYTDLFTEERIVTISMKEKTKNREEFIIGMDISVNNLQDKFLEIKQDVGKNDILLVDSNYNLIAHSLGSESVDISGVFSEEDIDALTTSTIRKATTLEGKDKLLLIQPLNISDWQVIISGDLSEITQLSNDIKRIMIHIGILMSILAFVVTYLYAYRTALPIEIVTKSLDSLSDMKLNSDAINMYKKMFDDETDDMVKSVENLKISFIDIVKTLRDSVISLTNKIVDMDSASVGIMRSMEDIGHTSTNIAMGVNRQTEMVINSNEQLVNLSDNLNHISLQVKEMERYTENIDNLNERGEYQVEELEKEVLQVQSNMMTLEKDIKVLYNGMNDISNILDTINNITRQTNLLALNASIEAARVGAKQDPYF